MRIIITTQSAYITTIITIYVPQNNNYNTKLIIKTACGIKQQRCIIPQAVNTV